MQKFPIYSANFDYTSYCFTVITLSISTLQHTYGARSHELHRLYFLRRQARAHFRNSKTEEKSRSDCAQLTEMQNSQR